MVAYRLDVMKKAILGLLWLVYLPVGAADRIYLLSETGKTVVLRRGVEPKVLAVNELNGRFHASPVFD